MMGVDAEYCLRRAEQEWVRIERAVSPEARAVHRELRERYLDRAGTVRPTLSIVTRA